MKIWFSLTLLLVLFSSCRQAPAGKEYPWKPYSAQAIKESMAQHKPVVIDFWAEWCPNCHDLERMVFSLPEVQAKLDKVTALRMDVTNQDDSAVQDILQQYQIEGVPTVVFLDSHGREVVDARITGLGTPQDFDQSFAMLKVLK
jgi:thiol:disulfide interchange protein DsbD